MSATLTRTAAAAAHPTAGATRRPRRGPAPAAGAASRAALTTLQAAFEKYFERALPKARRLPRPLHEAIRYSALSPGKRLRPLLVLTACEAVGGDWRRALPAAAAVECVHAFSLVHDDLPAMDDDDYRRGRLTTHKRFGEALGVLAGDALLAAAFEELARLAERGVPAPRVVEAVGVLARAAGSAQLVGGQALDLAAEGRPVTGAQVRAIHARKTGALIAASLVLGGLAGGASRARCRTLDRAGLDLGIAFQIRDDLLNRASTLAALGKRTGTDDARGKATYPRAVGEERSQQEAARRVRAAMGRVVGFGPRAARLARLVVTIAERER